MTPENARASVAVLMRERARDVHAFEEALSVLLVMAFKSGGSKGFEVVQRPSGVGVELHDVEFGDRHTHGNTAAACRLLESALNRGLA